MHVTCIMYFPHDVAHQLHLDSNEFYQICFPIKVKYVSEKRLHNKCISNEAKHLINEKSAAYSQFRSGDITWQRNNKIKNDLNRKISKIKLDFFSSSFENFKNDSKKCWDLMRQLTGTTQSRKNIICLLENNTETTDIQRIVNIFSNYFSKVGENLDQMLPTNQVSPYQLITRNEKNFYLFPVTPEEVCKIIAKLKITRTHPNHISVKFFKSIRHLISIPLCNIINASFQSGIFPNFLKSAKITPVYKKGNKKIPSNYRPISSLPFISKIYERAMTNRLISFFEKFNLFSNKQFGFLKNRSTKDAIYDFTETVYDALDSKKHTVSALIDLKSAFDTVNHQILLKKLELYGVRGHGLDWIRSYLTDRDNYVALNNKYSTHTTSNIGIPQGSIIGPILFIIYINDLPSISQELSATLYADDTNFSHSDSDYEQLVTTLNMELSKVHDWTVANRLTINVSKTELLLFSNRSPNTFGNNILLNGDSIEFVDHARFLGVFIDGKLNFESHINHVLGKISRHAGILLKIHRFLTPHAKILYYNSFILPYLSYNILHWGSTNYTHLIPLITIQKRIIRTMANGNPFQFEPSTPLFHRLKILKLKDLYKYQLAVDTHIKFTNGFYEESHGLNLHNSTLYVSPKFHRLSRTQQSITFMGPSIWNSLPRTLKSIASLPAFKKQLKEHLLKKYEN